MSDTPLTTAPRRPARETEVDPSIPVQEPGASDAPPPSDPHPAEVHFARMMEIEEKLARARLGREKLSEMMKESEAQEALLREEQFRLNVELGRSLESARLWDANGEASDAEPR